MSVLHFEYKMEIKYEEYVGRCYFTIKCIPKEDARQHLLGLELSVLPETTYSSGKDSFGNRQIYGPITSLYFMLLGMWKSFRQITKRRQGMKRRVFSAFPMESVYPVPDFWNIIGHRIFQGVRAIMEYVWH